MPITPDTKDWTWVLTRPCPQCGFAAAQLAVEDVGPLVRRTAEAWAQVLQRPDAAVRPDDSTWSPLEYGAHVRDVHRVMGERLALILGAQDPVFASWDQDAAAVRDRYARMDPATVAHELAAAAERTAAAFDAVTPDQHDRTGRRSDGAVFSVAGLARYCAHETVHHLWDVSD